jgi:signal transduction histidine kinase
MGAVPSLPYGRITSQAVTTRGVPMATARAGSAAAWGGAVLAAVRSIASARTWLALIHLISGWVIGLIALLVLVVVVPVSAVMLLFALAGVPMFWALLLACGQFARAERGRFALLLDVRIPAPAGLPAAGGRHWWVRFLRSFTSAQAWKQFLYALLRFPLAAAQVAVLVPVWGAGLAMFALPGYDHLLPRDGTLFGGSVPIPAGVTGLAATAAAGLALLLAAPQLTWALALADAAVARLLLGPGPSRLRARIGELERSRARVVDSAEAERRRIERDLHDGAQQRLVALAMDLGRARARFADDPQAARAIVDQAHAEAKAALLELRNLVRGVHPPVLTDRGLDAALSGLAALSPVPVAVHVSVAVRPSASVEAIAYFVVAEALTNVAKHSRATGATVSVGRHENTLSVVISDDGIGGADPGGQGLVGLADRVTGVDGRLTVRSPAGGGTVITAELPCAS